MRIDGSIGLNKDDPWVKRLEEDSRLAPFNSILTAINASLSSQRSISADAEQRMFRAGAAGVLSGGLALALYSTGSHEGAAAFGVVAAGSAIVLLIARVLRNVASSEAELIERHLVNAGFKLAWRRQRGSPHSPIVVTVEWPAH